MIQKFSENQNFLKKFLNGPIRKVIMLKVKFEDLPIFPVLGIPDFSLLIFRMTQFVKKAMKSEI